MNRKRRAFLWSAAILGIVGIIAFTFLSPRHRFADASELRAVIDPRLLVKLPADPEAQERFRRLEALVPTSDGVPTGQIDFADVEKILEEGPVEEPLEARPEPGAAPMEYLIAISEGWWKTFEKDELASIKHQLLFSSRLLDGARSYRLSSSCWWTERTVAGQINSFILDRQTSVTEVEQLLDLIPEDACMRYDLERRAAADMQAALHWMANPFVLRRPSARLEDSANPWEVAYEQSLWTGQYDAIKTAKLLSDHLVAQLDHKSPPAELDQVFKSSFGSYYYSAATTSYSVRTAPAASDFQLFPDYEDKQGWERTVEEFKFKWKRNRYPNSVGLALVASNYEAGYTTVDDFPPLRNLCRVAVALHIYRRRHGAFPGDLKRLVSDGILPSVPLDCRSGLPLQFDVSKKVVWSPGVAGLTNAPKLVSLWQRDQPAMTVWQ